MPFDRIELIGPWARPVILRLGCAAKIGRAPGNDVVVDHPSVSRTHAVVEWRSEGELTLHDLGSSNGSRINKVAVLKDKPASIPDGAALSLGDVLISVRLIPSGEAAASRAGKFDSRPTLRQLFLELERTAHTGTLELTGGAPQKVLLGYDRGLVIAAHNGENDGFPVVDELLEGAWTHRGTYRITDVLELERQPLRVRMSEVLGDEEPDRPKPRETERLKKRW